MIGVGNCFAASKPSYKSFEIRNALALSKAKFIVVEPGLLSCPRRRNAASQRPTFSYLPSHPLIKDAAVIGPQLPNRVDEVPPA